jgi:hypothetical protein
MSRQENPAGGSAIPESGRDTSSRARKGRVRLIAATLAAAAAFTGAAAILSGIEVGGSATAGTVTVADGGMGGSGGSGGGMSGPGGGGGISGPHAAV